MPLAVLLACSDGCVDGNVCPKGMQEKRRRHEARCGHRGNGVRAVLRSWQVCAVRRGEDA